MSIQHSAFDEPRSTRDLRRNKIQKYFQNTEYILREYTFQETVLFMEIPLRDILLRERQRERKSERKKERERQRERQRLRPVYTFISYII